MSDYPCDMLSLLEAMKGDSWSDGQIQRYSIALMRIPPKIARLVVTEMCLETWRPSPMDILRAAAKKASPFPTADEAYAEMLHKAESVGMYGVPDPANQNCFLPGSPPFSHPLVAQAIAHCGGWRSICTGEAQMQEGLSKQFRGAYERAATKFLEQVIVALALPVKERSSVFFPQWTPYRLPVSWSPDNHSLAITATPIETPAITELTRHMPAEIRAKLKRVSLSVTSALLETDRNQQKRAEVESELRERFAKKLENSKSATHE